MLDLEGESAPENSRVLEALFNNGIDPEHVFVTDECTWRIDDQVTMSVDYDSSENDTWRAWDTDTDALIAAGSLDTVAAAVGSYLNGSSGN
jgi:hypothetical protein